jgi:hypothetical protein
MMNQPNLKIRLSPVSEGVSIVKDMVQLTYNGAMYEEKAERLHKLMETFALAEIRPVYEPQLREADPGYVLTVEDVASNDETPMAEAYWAATSLFFRRVFQACAAAA